MPQPSAASWRPAGAAVAQGHLWGSGTGLLLPLGSSLPNLLGSSPDLLGHLSLGLLLLLHQVGSSCQSSHSLGEVALLVEPLDGEVGTTPGVRLEALGALGQLALLEPGLDHDPILGLPLNVGKGV